VSILQDNLRIGGIKNAILNLEIIGHQNLLKTRSHLRALLKRPRDCSLMTKYKKLLQKIDNLGIQ